MARGIPNRASESRAATSREAEASIMPTDDEGGADGIDLTRKPRDTAYMWGRLTCLGERDQDNMRDLFQQGWRPVPPDQHPEMLADFNGFEDLVGKSNWIESKGRVLMRRPKVKQDAHDRFVRAESAQNMAVADRMATTHATVAVMPREESGAGFSEHIRDGAVAHVQRTFEE